VRSLNGVEQVLYEDLLRRTVQRPAEVLVQPDDRVPHALIAAIRENFLDGEKHRVIRVVGIRQMVVGAAVGFAQRFSEIAIPVPLPRRARVVSCRAVQHFSLLSNFLADLESLKNFRVDTR
jgi:hypothetical protein